ncbi:protein mono-ADP-ribosyltransferase PARP14-like [Haliotis rubra]|uniref:protein mono-ADP-ribosyltransferase PARP14-like n=1 Tax=Haliotis rubra TaxID=36100 RepID=UPI001EE5E682|nr:protein mono-ADP-ribosyltransferase PARP14-like [Haliotis rubra]
MSNPQGQLPRGNFPLQQREQGHFNQQQQQQQQQQQPCPPLQQQMQNTQYAQSLGQDGQFAVKSEGFGHYGPQQDQVEFQSLMGPSLGLSGPQSVMQHQISQEYQSPGEASQGRSQQYYQHQGIHRGSHPVQMPSTEYGDPQSVAQQQPEVPQSTLEAQGDLHSTMATHQYQHQGTPQASKPVTGPSHAYGDPQSMMRKESHDLWQKCYSMKGDKEDQHILTRLGIPQEGDPSHDCSQHQPHQGERFNTSRMHQSLPPDNKHSDFHPSKQTSNSSSAYSAGHFQAQADQTHGPGPRPYTNDQQHQFQAQSDQTHGPGPRPYPNDQQCHFQTQANKTHGPGPRPYPNDQQHQFPAQADRTHGPGPRPYPNDHQHHFQTQTDQTHGPDPRPYPNDQQRHFQTQANQTHGPGPRSYPNDQQHQFQVQSDQTHGPGPRPYPNDHQHHFQTQTDQTHGPDPRPYPNDQQRHFQTQANQTHGPDPRSYPNDQQRQFQAQTDQTHGPGPRSYPNDQQRQFQVQSDQTHGPGPRSYPNDQQRQFQAQSDQTHGPGPRSYPNDQQRQFQAQSDQTHGPGPRSYPNDQQRQFQAQTDQTHGPDPRSYPNDQQRQFQAQTDQTHGLDPRSYPNDQQRQFQAETDQTHGPGPRPYTNDQQHQFQAQADLTYGPVPRSYPNDQQRHFQTQADQTHGPVLRPYANDQQRQFQVQADQTHGPVPRPYPNDQQRQFPAQTDQAHSPGLRPYPNDQQRQFQAQTDQTHDPGPSIYPNYHQHQPHQQTNLQRNVGPFLPTPTGSGQRDPSARHLQTNTEMFEQCSVSLEYMPHRGPHHAVSSDRDQPHKLQGGYAVTGPNPNLPGDTAERPTIQYSTGNHGYPADQPNDQVCSPSDGATDSHIDEHRLLLVNIGPGTTEDTLENFLESKAEAEVERLDWAEDKKSAIVTFNAQPDVPTISAACKSTRIEGSNMEVKPVPRSRCLKVGGLSRNTTKDNVRFYFENKKYGGGPTDEIDLCMETNSALVHYTQYGTAEKVIEKAPHKLRDHILDVRIHVDLPGFTQCTDHEDGFRILVLDIGPNTSQDTLENFLEAKAGQEVKHVEWGNGRKAAVVTFKDRTGVKTIVQLRVISIQMIINGTVSNDLRARLAPVAERVCQLTHKLKEHVLTVTMHTDTPGFVPDGSTAGKTKGKRSPSDDDGPAETEDEVPDDKKMLILNIATGTSRDTLENFLESKAAVDVADIQWGGGDSCKSALVTFHSRPCFATVKEACSKKMVEGHRLKAKQVMKSRCLRVTGLPDNASEDDVYLFFENKRRGGPLKEMRFTPGEPTAYLWFKEYGVAEKLCAQTLKLKDKILKVNLHVDIAEFMPKESEKEKGNCSGTLQAETVAFSETEGHSQWRYLVKSVDARITRYISKSEPEKTKLQDDLKRHQCGIRFIQQPNGVILEATYNGTKTEGIDKKVWMKRADAALQDSLEEMDLTVETLKIPDENIMDGDQMKQDFQKTLAMMNVRIYGGFGQFHVVGCRERVKEAMESLNEMLVSAGPKESDTLLIKNYQIRYLQRSSFLLRCSKKHPRVEVHLKVREDSVTIEGPKAEVQSVKIMIHEELNSLQNDSLTFKTKEAVEILNTSSLPQQLEDSGVVCSWQKEDLNRVSLYCPNADDICRAKAIIKKIICEEIIPLDKSSSNSLQSADWREKQKQLVESNRGQLQIGVVNDAVMVAGDQSIFQDIVSEIDKYFDINSVREYFLKAEEPCARFLQAHCHKKVRQLELNLQDFKVHINFGDGSFACGFTITGLNDGINKTRKELEKLLSSVKSKDHSLMVPGIKHFFLKGRGKELLTGIEHQTQTIIRPKDLLQKIPTVTKSWTLPHDHIVSVVKGDICTLKVDAIAYTANTDLKFAAGLSKVIVAKGGKSIQEESAVRINMKGRPSVGEVVCTGAGRLPCKYILHSVSPKWREGKHGERDALQETMMNILRQCKRKRVRSLALPAISTGLGYPLAEAVKVILETLHKNLDKEHTDLREIILCDIKSSVVRQFIKTSDSIFHGTRSKRVESTKKEEEEWGEEEGEKNVEMEEGQKETDEGSEGDEEDSQSMFCSDSDDLSDAEDHPERIQVIVGELSRQKADVLVNPTGKDLNMSVGAVSRCLLEAGGKAIQTACKEKYPSGLKTGHVAVTTGGNLRCKEIYHGILQAWNNGKDAPDLVLQNLVKRCLEKADVHGYLSVAFPALGTGKLGFPADISASLMFKVASKFLEEHPGTSVQTIYFIVHHKDIPVKKAFEAESRKSVHNCNPTDHRGNAGTRHQDSKGDNQDTFTFGSVEIKIVQGDLTKEKTDCIVSSSGESFDLKHGAVSKALLSAAGSQLQDECTSKTDELSSTGLVLTQGYKLHCNNVLHLKVQTSAWGWGSTLLECLKKAEGEGMTSLSMPALGTGGQKIAPFKMASSLLYAVKKFADTHSQPALQSIRVVIFQSSMVNTYRAVFAGKQSGRDAPSRRHGHKERDSADNRPGTRHHGASHRVRADDKVVLRIYSDSWTNITAARDRLKELCADEFQHKTIGDKWANKIEKLDTEEMSRLEGVAGEHDVVIVRRGSALEITGRVRNVGQVHEKILELFQNEATNAHMKEEAKLVANLVEWMYVVDGKPRPFTMGLNCCLEKAYKAKEKKLEIKDARGRAYSVDFQKMTELPKTGGKPIKIERTEKAIRGGLSKMVKGEKEALAGTKTVYFPLTPKRAFKGNAEDLHFRTAESQFYRLLGTSGSTYCVTKVDYVVNPALIKKFRAAQVAMKAKRGPDKAEPVLAFHGTNVAYIEKICEGGFKKPGDPGFVAKTDTGYYGSGVYFSEYPEYSMGYIAGAQKILLSQVILGEVFHCTALMNGAALKPGYDSHTSPDGKELIIFDTACILPCFIVHYGPSQGVFTYTT